MTIDDKIVLAPSTTNKNCNILNISLNNLHISKYLDMGCIRNQNKPFYYKVVLQHIIVANYEASHKIPIMKEEN